MHILISDDHAVLRDGLKPFVSQIADDVVIHEACDYATTHKALDAQAMDLVILDLGMPGLNGFNGMDAAIHLKQSFPQTAMVIMSGGLSHENALRAIDLNFLGYIPKSLSGSAMLHALRLVLCDVPYYPPEILLPANAMSLQTTSLSLDTSPASNPSGNGVESAQDAALSVLTRREKEILTHLVEGASNRTIAESLGLTEITIKSHLRNIFRKIDANNRTQAVTFALNAGIQGVHAT